MADADQTTQQVRLDQYDNRAFDRGAPRWKEALWLVLQALFVSSRLPGTWHRVVLLRLFGASIGRKITLRPGLRVKFPWRLHIGAHSWIGESCWIDNLVAVRIGRHCCLSQGACLCTGNHDWSAERFDFFARSVVVKDCAWIAAFAQIGPGVTVGQGAVLSFGSTAVQDLLPWTIYSGHPCQAVKTRQIRRSRTDQHQ
ncbi:MAG: WcaF family extracellular polysaccharide biosynthesis acetyltransferase [Candidatus Electrothrix sp. YB6]